jgi:Tol biopolymer transport system component
MGAPSNGTLNLYRYDLISDVFELATPGLGTGNSNAPSISQDGVAIAFPSNANDLTTGNPSSWSDVYYSLRTGENAWATELVSRGVGGVAPNDASPDASISADGRWVAFLSYASNLIAGDSNGAPDIFVADATSLASPPERISVTGAATQIDGWSRTLSPSAISADGRYVAFAVDTPVSIDGSNAGTLEDVFVRDRQTDTTSLISKSTAGVAGSSSSDSPAISPDGRFVVFRSFSTNLVDSPTGSRIYLRDREFGTTGNMPLPSGAASCEDPRVSNTAVILAQCDMNSGFAQAFLYDAVEGAFYQVSTSLTAGNGNNASGSYSSVSANGLLAVFDSAASDLVADDTNSSIDVFVVVPEPAAASAGFAAVATLVAAARRRARQRR